MSRKKINTQTKFLDQDIEFEFTGCKFNVVFEPECLSEDEQDEIQKTINIMSERIFIDKSYVQCKDNKHDDVFLLLEGWNALMALLNETNYGDDATEDQYDVLVEFYYTMVLGYMYNIISMLYPDKISHIHIEVSNLSNMEVDILEDNAHEWRTYPGKWQTWKENN